MIRSSTMIAILIGAALCGAHALAIDSTSPIPIKRRLAVCMTKRMSSDRTISYNQATKVCKEQLKSQNQSLAANEAAKPVAAHAR